MKTRNYARDQPENKTEIMKINTGSYDHLIEQKLFHQYMYRLIKKIEVIGALTGAPWDI